jgi:hypothetical protein
MNNFKYRLWIALIFLIAILAAQTPVKYFLSYNDFIRGLDVRPTKVAGKAFLRAEYQKNLIRRLDFIEPNGNLSQQVQFYYNFSGDLQVKDVFNGDSLLISRTTYYPDDIQKQLIEKIEGRSWIPTQSDYLTVTTYDSLHKPIQQEVQSAGGTTVGRINREYNKRGDLIRETWTKGQDNQILTRTEFNFDYANEILYVTQYDSLNREVSWVALPFQNVKPDSISD